MKYLRFLIALLAIGTLLTAQVPVMGMDSGSPAMAAEMTKPATSAPGATTVAPRAASDEVAQVTPEEFYRSAWRAVEQNFLWRDRLDDWHTWERKFDGQLKTYEDAERAINQMLRSLNDGYTYYRNPALTQTRTTRADARGVVTSRMLPGNIGYIKIRTFSSNHMADELKAALQSLAGADAYIIDLRDNGGGFVRQAFLAFSMFVDEAHFTTLKGHWRGQAYTEELFVRKGDLETVENGRRTRTARQPNLTGDKPVVILVNGDSASASEMFSGAMRDSGRATIVGVRTFGKGIAQVTLSLARGASVQVTFAEYFLPKGDSVHGRGITPDHVLRQTGSGDAQLNEAVRVVRDLLAP